MFTASHLLSILKKIRHCIPHSCCTRISIRYCFHRFKMHSDVDWEIARIQSTQILQVLFLTDMLKSWLGYIFFLWFLIWCSYPKEKNLHYCIWQVCVAEILTPFLSTSLFRSLSTCLYLLASLNYWCDHLVEQSELVSSSGVLYDKRWQKRWQMRQIWQMRKYLIMYHDFSYFLSKKHSLHEAFKNVPLKIIQTSRKC